MARRNFTKQDAVALRKLRTARNMTQYQVADALGWVRSKVKRLEKHEVKTIEEKDLLVLKDLLEVRPKAPKKPRQLKKVKADRGKPKPRLDYEEGTAHILKALQDAREKGRDFLRRGELERATGFTACQVRTFCKTLEVEGSLRRDGNGRGMRYVALDGSGAPLASGEDGPGVSSQDVRRRLSQAHREAARRSLLPVLRKEVQIPAWLLRVLAQEGLDGLSIREVWGPKPPRNGVARKR